MPIYEYRCSKCGHELEALQKISDEPLKNCPACEQESLQKLVSAASFRLKGGGWYETDFKKGNKKHLADSGDKGSGGESGKESTAEKPAAKEKAGEQKTPGSSDTKSSSPGKSTGSN
jgi:putative FmdB family regulatory protein